MKSKTLDLPLHKAARGILLVNKPKGKTSFSLIGATRRLYNVQKVGHAGTLDPFATGVMVILVGKEYTRLSDKLLTADKEYIATLKLGQKTDSYDCDGLVLATSDIVPSHDLVLKTLTLFQGEVLQTPPMFSAKKIGGKKLYDLARQGITVERAPVKVHLQTTLLHYEYPFLTIKVACSKGTYIRTIAEDLGNLLGSYAHLSDLTRTKSGHFSLEQCIDGSILFAKETIQKPALFTQTF